MILCPRVTNETENVILVFLMTDSARGNNFRLVVEIEVPLFIGSPIIHNVKISMNKEKLRRKVKSEKMSTRPSLFISELRNVAEHYRILNVLYMN